MTNSSPWYRWPIEIDGLPFLKMVDLSSSLTVSHNQRLFLWVFLWFSYGFPMVFLYFPIVFLWFSYSFPVLSRFRFRIRPPRSRPQRFFRTRNLWSEVSRPFSKSKVRCPLVEKPSENGGFNGKTMGNHRKTIGKTMGNDRKTIGKWSPNGGLPSSKLTKRYGKWTIYE